LGRIGGSKLHFHLVTRLFINSLLFSIFGKAKWLIGPDTEGSSQRWFVVISNRSLRGSRYELWETNQAGYGPMRILCWQRGWCNKKYWENTLDDPAFMELLY